MKLSTVIVGLALAGMLFLGGCASKSAVEQAQATADQAMACCTDNADRFDRMYQKLMSK